jgi:hypothetical protein
MQYFRFYVSAILTSGIFFAFADTSLADPFTFESPWALRDHRDNTLIGGGIEDYISIGVNRAVIPGTDTFVPGIKATGTNSQTNETFALEACASLCYFSLIPHTPARASGSWTIQGMSGPDSDTVVAPPVGTGPGTNALPFAQNVQIVGNSFTPTVTWTLPPALVNHLNGIQLLNDGNVNRWRIRVNDRRATASFDQRLFTSAGNIPLNTTSFQIPSGIITANGKYRITVLLEGLTPFTRSRVRTDLILGPAALSRPFVFRQREDRTLAGGEIEDNLVFGADLVDTNDVLIQGANVTATNPGTAGSITLEECSGPGARFPFKCYFGDVPYTATIASNSWQIQATSQGLSGVLPKFGTGPGTGPLPFAQNVKVSGNSLTPMITWTLPPALVNHLNGIQLLNDGNVNFWRVRVNPLRPAKPTSASRTQRDILSGAIGIHN